MEFALTVERAYRASALRLSQYLIR